MSFNLFHQDEVDNLIRSPPEFTPYKNFQPTKKQQAFLTSAVVLSVICPICTWLFACFLTPTKRILKHYFVFAEVASIVWAFLCIVGIGLYIVSTLFDLR